MRSIFLLLFCARVLCASSSYSIQSGSGTASIWPNVGGGTRALSNYFWAASSGPTPPPPFVYSSSVDFQTASNSYLAPAGWTRLASNEAVSFVFWMKVIGAQSKDSSPWDENAGPGWQINFAHTISKIEPYIGGNTGAIYKRDANTWPVDTWFHLTITYDGSQSAAGLLMYINGASESLVTLQNDLTVTGTGNFGPFIGAEGTINLSMTGRMNSAAVYSTALSAADVAATYNGGVPVDLSTLSSYSNIRAWYRMGNCTGDTTSTIKNCANPGTNDAAGSNVTIVTDSP